MVAAMKGIYRQARGYNRGRRLSERKSVNLLVIHSAEGARTVADLGAWFARTTSGSSHAGVDSAGNYGQYVNYGDTAWTNPPLNQESDTLETCAFARWSRKQWLANPKMLEATAHWIAWRATQRRIPLRVLTTAQVKAGYAGVCDHDAVSKAFRASDHWDVGANFPWDVVMKRAKEIAGVGGSKPSKSNRTVYTVRKGDTLSAIAKKHDLSVSDLAKTNGIKDKDVINIGQKLVLKSAKKKDVGVSGRYPLPSSHYYSTPARSRSNHSGYYSSDRPAIALIQREVGVKADGQYGPNTRRAVIKWQRANGVAADGVVGPRTWARMRTVG